MMRANTQTFIVRPTRPRNDATHRQILTGLDVQDDWKSSRLIQTVQEHFPGSDLFAGEVLVIGGPGPKVIAISWVGVATADEPEFERF